MQLFLKTDIVPEKLNHRIVAEDTGADTLGIYISKLVDA
jgi:hypothetical protein